MKKNSKMKTKSSLSLCIALILCFQQAGFAQLAGPLPGVPSYINGYVAPDRFRPEHLRSLALDPVSGGFNLTVDNGDRAMSKEKLKASAETLMKYFRIGLALPDSSFWVNLRPDGELAMIDPALEKTDLGKILLAADLQLKKDMALFTSPRTEEGRRYWDSLYREADKLFAGEEITVPAVTRPWIVPSEIILGESENGVYIYKATLKVMLEQDYLKNSLSFSDKRLEALNELSSRLLRELVIPKLTREVNSSRKYAALRQVFYSLVMAQWFKQKFRSGASGPGNLFGNIDRGDLTGLTSSKKWSKDLYFRAYIKSFAKGEYDLSETTAGASGPTVRQYTSGGFKMPGIDSLPLKTIPLQEPSASHSFRPLDPFLASFRFIDNSIVSAASSAALADGGNDRGDIAERAELAALNLMMNLRTGINEYRKKGPKEIVRYLTRSHRSETRRQALYLFLDSLPNDKDRAKIIRSVLISQKMLDIIYLFEVGSYFSVSPQDMVNLAEDVIQLNSLFRKLKVKEIKNGNGGLKDYIVSTSVNDKSQRFVLLRRINSILPSLQPMRLDPRFVRLLMARVTDTYRGFLEQTEKDPSPFLSLVAFLGAYKNTSAEEKTKVIERLLGVRDGSQAASGVIAAAKAVSLPSEQAYALLFYLASLTSGNIVDRLATLKVLSYDDNAARFTLAFKKRLQEGAVENLGKLLPSELNSLLDPVAESVTGISIGSLEGYKVLIREREARARETYEQGRLEDTDVVTSLLHTQTYKEYAEEYLFRGLKQLSFDILDSEQLEQNKGVEIIDGEKRPVALEEALSLVNDNLFSASYFRMADPETEEIVRVVVLFPTLKAILRNRSGWSPEFGITQRGSQNLDGGRLASSTSEYDRDLRMLMSLDQRVRGIPVEKIENLIAGPIPVRILSGPDAAALIFQKQVTPEGNAAGVFRSTGEPVLAREAKTLVESGQVIPSLVGEELIILHPNPEGVSDAISAGLLDSRDIIGSPVTRNEAQQLLSDSRASFLQLTVIDGSGNRLDSETAAEASNDSRALFFARGNTLLIYSMPVISATASPAEQEAVLARQHEELLGNYARKTFLGRLQLLPADSGSATARWLDAIRKKEVTVVNPDVTLINAEDAARELAAGTKILYVYNFAGERGDSEEMVYVGFDNPGQDNNLRADGGRRKKIVESPLSIQLRMTEALVTSAVRESRIEDIAGNLGYDLFILQDKVVRSKIARPVLDVRSLGYDDGKQIISRSREVGVSAPAILDWEGEPLSSDLALRGLENGWFKPYRYSAQSGDYLVMHLSVKGMLVKYDESREQQAEDALSRDVDKITSAVISHIRNGQGLDGGRRSRGEHEFLTQDIVSALRDATPEELRSLSEKILDFKKVDQRMAASEAVNRIVGGGQLTEEKMRDIAAALREDVEDRLLDILQVPLMHGGAEAVAAVLYNAEQIVRREYSSLAAAVTNTLFIHGHSPEKIVAWVVNESSLPGESEIIEKLLSRPPFSADDLSLDGGIEDLREQIASKIEVASLEIDNAIRVMTPERANRYRFYIVSLVVTAIELFVRKNGPEAGRALVQYFEENDNPYFSLKDFTTGTAFIMADADDKKTAAAGKDGGRRHVGEYAFLTPEIVSAMRDATPEELQSLNQKILEFRKVDKRMVASEVVNRIVGGGQLTEEKMRDIATALRENVEDRLLDILQVPLFHGHEAVAAVMYNAERIVRLEYSLLAREVTETLIGHGHSPKKLMAWVVNESKLPGESEIIEKLLSRPPFSADDLSLDGGIEDLREQIASKIEVASLEIDNAIRVMTPERANRYRFYIVSLVVTAIELFVRKNGPEAGRALVQYFEENDNPYFSLKDFTTGTAFIMDTADNKETAAKAGKDGGTSGDFKILAFEQRLAREKLLRAKLRREGVELSAGRPVFRNDAIRIVENNEIRILNSDGSPADLSGSSDDLRDGSKEMFTHSALPGAKEDIAVLHSTALFFERRAEELIRKEAERKRTDGRADGGESESAESASSVYGELVVRELAHGDALIRSLDALRDINPALAFHYSFFARVSTIANVSALLEAAGEEGLAARNWYLANFENSVFSREDFTSGKALVMADGGAFLDAARERFAASKEEAEVIRSLIGDVESAIFLGIPIVEIQQMRLLRERAWSMREFSLPLSVAGPAQLSRGDILLDTGDSFGIFYGRAQDSIVYVSLNSSNTLSIERLSFEAASRRFSVLPGFNYVDPVCDDYLDRLDGGTGRKAMFTLPESRLGVSDVNLIDVLRETLGSIGLENAPVSTSTNLFDVRTETGTLNWDTLHRIHFRVYTDELFGNARDIQGEYVSRLFKKGIRAMRIFKAIGPMHADPFGAQSVIIEDRSGSPIEVSISFSPNQDISEGDTEFIPFSGEADLVFPASASPTVASILNRNIEQIVRLSLQTYRVLEADVLEKLKDLEDSDEFPEHILKSIYQMAALRGKGSRFARETFLKSGSSETLKAAALEALAQLKADDMVVRADMRLATERQIDRLGGSRLDMDGGTRELYEAQEGALREKFRSDSVDYDLSPGQQLTFYNREDFIAVAEGLLGGRIVDAEGRPMDNAEAALALEKDEKQLFKHLLFDGSNNTGQIIYSLRDGGRETREYRAGQRKVQEKALRVKFAKQDSVLSQGIEIEISADKLYRIAEGWHGRKIFDSQGEPVAHARAAEYLLLGEKQLVQYEAVHSQAGSREVIGVLYDSPKTVRLKEKALGEQADGGFLHVRALPTARSLHVFTVNETIPVSWNKDGVTAEQAKTLVESGEAVAFEILGRVVLHPTSKGIENGLVPELEKLYDRAPESVIDLDGSKVNIPGNPYFSFAGIVGAPLRPEDVDGYLTWSSHPLTVVDGNGEAISKASKGSAADWQSLVHKENVHSFLIQGTGSEPDTLMVVDTVSLATPDSGYVMPTTAWELSIWQILEFEKAMRNRDLGALEDLADEILRDNENNIKKLLLKLNEELKEKVEIVPTPSQIKQLTIEIADESIIVLNPYMNKLERGEALKMLADYKKQERKTTTPILYTFEGKGVVRTILIFHFSGYGLIGWGDLGKADSGKTSSADGGGEVGGIDLSATSSVIRPASAVGSPIPVLAPADAINLWASVRQKLTAGEMPYEEFKQCLASCSRDRELAGEYAEITSCINEILKLEEERALPTSPQMAELLAYL